MLSRDGREPDGALAGESAAGSPAPVAVKSARLSHFGRIVPCGIAEYPVTSLADIGIDATLQDFDEALAETLPGFLAALAKAGQDCSIPTV